MVFAANFLQKLTEQKREKLKSAVSPNSAKSPSSEKNQDSDKKTTAFGISTLMGNFFKVSQNIIQSPSKKGESY